MSDFGQHIKSKREATGLSLKKLGNICGISDTELLRIENGKRKKPSWEHLCRIARALNIHPFEFLLIAGYISQEDIHPETNLRGLEEFDSSDMSYLQLFIDFMISRKSANKRSEGWL